MRLDVNGLTEEQRHESDVAELEDGLPKHAGAIQGQIRDASNEPLVGVTITVSSPALEAMQIAISDEHGYYAILGLPVGEYAMKFYYLDLTFERPNIAVTARRASPAFQRLDIDPPDVEVAIVHVDESIQIDGRTFERVIAAAGAQGADGPSVTFSSNCGLENTYIVE